MARKGKQPGGHNPLTYNERKKLTCYGTTTARLGTESHNRFGDCCLGLAPAIDPVVTPSGHIYSREAIVSYLLTKTRELTALRIAYETRRTAILTKSQTTLAQTTETAITEFARKDSVQPTVSKEGHAKDIKRALGRTIDVEGEEERKRSLKRTSFWLSESQPQYDNEGERDEEPPNRPRSPMTGGELRRKDLVSITLGREEAKGGKKGKCVCAVSGKAITTQEVVVIKKTGVVMLKEFYESLAKEERVCPVSGKKFREKDVMELKKGTSGYAASGKVVAKKYRPTLT